MCRMCCKKTNRAAKALALGCRVYALVGFCREHVPRQLCAEALMYMQELKTMLDMAQGEESRKV